MPGEAMASTPGAELGGHVVGDGSVVVPWQARVLGTWSLARGGGTRVEACGLLVKPEKPTVVCWLNRKNQRVAGLVVWASKPSERVKGRGPSQGGTACGALGPWREVKTRPDIEGLTAFLKTTTPIPRFTVPAKTMCIFPVLPLRAF